MASLETKYIDAASVVKGLHKGFDAGLVRNSANSHKPPIDIVDGFFFEPVVVGAYNPRSPRATENEASLVRKLRSVRKLCMDYRGSGNIGNVDLSSTLAWIDAGGALQTGEDHNAPVYEADMNLWDAIFALNPGIYVELYYHLETCGGGNFYTSGKVAAAREDGREAEFVEPYAQRYANHVRSLRRQGAVDLSRMW